MEIVRGRDDTVWVPPGERHWHSGGPESLVVQVAISLGTTTWLDAVAEGEVWRR